MKYRADIDGLRALAIIPVVLFHAGYGLFSGGFVGVDVFFVISGYLITSILIKDMKGKGFSLSRFYERRARRILPAYIFMMVVVTFCGYYLFLASEFKSLAESALASLSFVSNFFFWKNSGYFSIQAESSPFLHTWSLSVEEQFYIFFPLGLMFLYKYFNEKIIYSLIIAVLGLSFMISVAGMEYSISAVFYLLPSRAWELLVGAVIATGILPNLKNKAINESLSLIGFLMILSAMFLYTKNTIFPGKAALLPAVGTGLIIYSGLIEKRTCIGNLLSLKPFVIIGGFSYSLYLWHWPIFVFMKNIYGELVPSHVVVAAVLISFLCAWASLHMIEKPFLTKRILPRKKPLLVVSVFSLVSAMAICLILILSNGFPDRFDEKVLSAELALNDFSQRRKDCHIEKRNSISYDDKCIFGGDVNPTYAFWGDSHSVELSDSLGGEAKTIGISGVHISYSSCPPSQGFSWLSRPMCGVHNSEVLDGLIKDNNIKTVFLIARYNSYVRDQEMTKSMLEGFEETIKSLQTSGKKVVVIYPIPRSKGVAPLDLARILHRNGDVNNYHVTLDEYIHQNETILPELKKIVQDNYVDVIYPAEILCSDKQLCRFFIDGRVTHFDDDHISLSGSELFIPSLLRYLIPQNENSEAKL
jgi:peptidoglycan/LPS O-acetylase OafA/YrhL